MKANPVWLKLLVAFGGPFSTTLAATWHEHMGHTLAGAFAAGFGGLAALGGNNAMGNRHKRMAEAQEP